jgi:hypothetical protein
MPVIQRPGKQVWAVGNTVKVGFLRLLIVGFIPTPGDGEPDIYQLEATSGRRYEFQPHMGLYRVD